MSKLYWLFLIYLLPQSAICAGLKTTDISSFEHDTTTFAKIDEINKKIYTTFLSDPTGARKLAEAQLIASKTIGYKKGIGQSLLNIGVTYWSQSYNQISLLYLDTAIHYISKNEHSLLSTIYRHTARDYMDLRNYDKANVFLNKAEFEAGTDEYLLAEIVTERSLIFARKKETDLAVNEVYRALKMVRPLHNTETEAILLGRLSYIYSNDTPGRNYDKALSCVDSSINLSYVTNNKRLRASCWDTKAFVLLNQHKPDEALQYANKALALSDSLGIADITTRVYKSIINIYKSKGDTKMLLFYQYNYTAFLEKQVKTSQQNSSQLVADYFELNEKLRNLEEINHKDDVYNVVVKSQKNIIIILSVSLILLIVALYVVYRYYREKRILAKNLNEQHLATIAQTQLIEIQAQHLEELNSLKNKLLLVIGHDLRGPIGNLSSLTSLFEGGHLQEAEVKQVMSSISPVVKGAELTLKNLLEWAENQIKGTNLQATCEHLQPVVDEIENTFKYSFDQKHITFTNEVKAEHTVFIDPNHLKVILRNLISNAIKFTPNKGQISVTSHTIKDKITISIKDTGRGMNTEEIERLLSVKTHFTKPGTQGEKGTGIGLLLCRELIELNGGELWLTSEVDQGTTFYFSVSNC
ncbi:HAMP domain-containing histidine kinase [Mucilaginibacter sp. HMF5004]|uniref:sensor histidine kinase n=1 Tax=Mucilaginibacter rivuli TaxID=2857527 RepID=UPI001C5FF59C|nr:HAMP domain-containing sensor histidine kinase [Mucilaginibacter rivuli]MBW4889121.1 HAMP domain-containing histidine kinase [Mucilaginibacter rivuli]